MQTPYDPLWVQQHFDGFAEKEWERLAANPVAQVSLHIHSHYLRKYLQPACQVLEIGAGAGRFTQVLAELGARICVADISPVQLELNQKYAAEYDFDSAVSQRIQADMCDLALLHDAQFDAVVCYGGPLSYVFDRRDQAMREMLRVLRPGGTLLASVMSLWGTVHWCLDGVLPIPAEQNWNVIRTGNNCPENNAGCTHRFHFFRAKELRDFAERFGLAVEDMSASACLSVGWGDKLLPFRQDPGLWRELLSMEVEACREPGALDMGTHLIIVARKVGQ